MSRTARRRLLLVGFLAVLAVAAAGFWYARQAVAVGIPASAPTSEPSVIPPVGERSAPAHSTSPTSPLSTTPTPGGLEPGPGEAVATDAPQTTAGGKVTVDVTYGGWDDGSASAQVSGLVVGVVEDGGVCTLSLTQGATTVTEQHPAVADAATTTCGTLTVAGTRLSPGTWRAVLSYTSVTSSGAASPVAITVPAR